MKLMIEFEIIRRGTIAIDASDDDLSRIQEDGQLPFWDQAYQNALQNPEYEECDYCVRDQTENVLAEWDN